MTVVERTHCAIVERRTARKRHRCASCPGWFWIEPGEVYLLHTCFPGHADTEQYYTASAAQFARNIRLVIEQATEWPGR